VSEESALVAKQQLEEAGFQSAPELYFWNAWLAR
jgi:hypothetical protein